MPLFYTILAASMGFLELKDVLSIWFKAGMNDYLNFTKFPGYKRASPEIKATLEFYVQWIAVLKLMYGVTLIQSALLSRDYKYRACLAVGISCCYCMQLFRWSHSCTKLVNLRQLGEGMDVALDFVSVCILAPLFAIAAFLQFRAHLKLQRKSAAAAMKIS
jgi:hypothetical protein